MDTLLHVGLSNALMATALALPAAVVGSLCQRPALAHALWLLVILKLLTPPIVPVPVLWLNSSARVSAAAGNAGNVRGDLEVTEAAGTRPGSVAGEAATPAPARAEARSLPISSFDSAGTLWPGLTWAWVVCLVWGAGSGLWLGTIAWRVRRLQRLLRVAQQAPPEVQERTRRLAQGLRLARCPGVWFVPGHVSPMLLALVGPPRLLLPKGLWSELSHVQQDALLAHELAHLRRWDHWVRWLELTAVSLYWWHPVTWLAQRELQEAGEQCCDGWVLAVLPAAADAYAEALLKTVAYLSRARATLPVGASGAGQVHLLKRRLIMILNGTAPKALSPTGRWAMLALGAVLLPLLPTWAHSQDSPQNAFSRPDRPELSASPAADGEREEQISQARRAVRELTSELKQMRTRMDALSGRLHEAQVRLAELEGRPIPSTPADLPRAEPMLPANKLPPAASKARPSVPALAYPAVSDRESPPAVAKDPGQPAIRADRGSGDYDQRLREVEAKLDRLLEEFKRMQERRPGR